MDLGLEGRTAIVCGASEGIGLGIAEALAGEGANVVMFARRPEPLQREAERLGAVAVAGDVTDADAVARLVETAAETLRRDRHPRQQLGRSAADASARPDARAGGGAPCSSCSCPSSA